MWWLPLSVLTYLAIHDTWFYWTHRWMHRPAVYRVMHVVHHASHPPTAWTAMSFHPWETLTGALVIPALVLLVPIHVGALLTVLTIMTIMGITNHMGWEMFPKFLVQGSAGKWLITASHHQLHHQRNKCNYGLYFRFWDRLCGTDGGLGSFEPRRSGRRAASHPQLHRVNVEIAGLRNGKGVVRLCMTSRVDEFPACKKGAAMTASVAAKQGRRCITRSKTCRRNLCHRGLP